MKGHIRERSPGRWAIVIDIRDPATGKRKRRWHSFAGTKRGAQIECARLVTAIDVGTYLEPSKTTLAVFLEQWLEHMRPLLSPLSHERYCEVARKSVMPLLGAVILTKLRPVQISEAYAKALSSGRRDGKGGLAALRWRDVDLFRNMGPQLAVVSSAEQTKAGVRYKEPKSGRSRTVALSATVVHELRAHRIAQAQELLRVGVRLSDDMFVVAQTDGSPLQPRSLTHEWVRLIAGTSLPRMRFHDLRHAHATHLLSNGIHPKVASERLGHSKVGITLDLYSHVLPGMQEDAVARVDDALSEAIQKRASKAVG